MDKFMDGVAEEIHGYRKKIAELKERLYELEDIKHDFDMYRNAWIRELGGRLIPKTHEIDALVLTTRKLKEDTRREVLRDCAKSLIDSVTRVDIVSLSEQWSVDANLEKK